MKTKKPGLLLAPLMMALCAYTQVVRADVADCLQLHDRDARLACYDTAAGYEAPPEVVQAQEDEFGGEHIEARSKSSSRPQRVEEIDATIERLRRGPRGETVFYLDNGQVWAQTTPRFIDADEGQQVQIKRGRVGGYTLLVNKRVGTKVRRLR